VAGEVFGGTDLIWYLGISEQTSRWILLSAAFTSTSYHHLILPSSLARCYQLCVLRGSSVSHFVSSEARCFLLVSSAAGTIDNQMLPADAEADA
jgi:hypothetical protein